MSPAEDHYLREQAFPTLDEAQLALLFPFGERRITTAGDVLFEAGRDRPSLVVVLSGRAQVIDRSDGSDRQITSAGPGEFVGELGLLTGQTAYATCLVQEPGEVVVIPAAVCRR